MVAMTAGPSLAATVVGRNAARSNNDAAKRARWIIDLLLLIPRPIETALYFLSSVFSSLKMRRSTNFAISLAVNFDSPVSLRSGAKNRMLLSTSDARQSTGPMLAASRTRATFAAPPKSPLSVASFAASARSAGGAPAERKIARRARFAGLGLSRHQHSLAARMPASRCEHGLYIA